MTCPPPAVRGGDRHELGACRAAAPSVGSTCSTSRRAAPSSARTASSATWPGCVHVDRPRQQARLHLADGRGLVRQRPRRRRRAARRGSPSAAPAPSGRSGGRRGGWTPRRPTRRSRRPPGRARGRRRRSSGRAGRACRPAASGRRRSRPGAGRRRPGRRSTASSAGSTTRSTVVCGAGGAVSARKIRVGPSDGRRPGRRTSTGRQPEARARARKARTASSRCWVISCGQVPRCSTPTQRRATGAVPGRGSSRARARAAHHGVDRSAPTTAA